MATKTYTIQGVAISRVSGTGMRGIRVEAWDEDRRIDDLLGSDVTDGKGQFEIPFDDSFRDEICELRKPDVYYFRVFQNDHLILSTEESVCWDVGRWPMQVNISVDLVPPMLQISSSQLSPGMQGPDVVRVQQAMQALGRTVPADENGKLGPGSVAVLKTLQAEAGLPQTGIVDVATVNAINVKLTKAATDPRVIRGSVRDPNGSPFTAGFVEVFGATLSGERSLGRSTLDSPDGSYEITYQPPPGRDGRVDLRAEVRDGRGTLETIPSGASILANAGPLEVVDFVVGPAAKPPLWEFEVMRGDQLPLLGRALSDVEVDRFVGLYLETSQDPDAFWNNVTADEVFGSRAPQLKLTVQLAALTGNHVALVMAIQSRRDIQQASDVVRLSAEDWTALVRTQGIGVPTGTPGSTPDEQTQNYVQQILRQVEAAFPTQFFAQRLRASPVADLLKSHAYDLRTTYTDKFFQQNPEAARSLTAELRGQLSNFQRLHRLTNSAQETIALATAGVRSAQQIARMDATVFAEQHKETQSAERAGEVHARARQTSALALALYGEHSVTLNRTELTTLAPEFEAALDETLAIAALAAAFQPPLQPDARVEVLEAGSRWRIWDESHAYTIVKQNDALQIAARSRQTDGSSDDRRATPQYRTRAAYEELSQSVYPWNLPFDLNHEEAQTYLKHLGVARAELIEALRPVPEPFDANSPVVYRLAAERLGLTDVERKILTGEALSPPCEPEDSWGSATVDSLKTVHELLDRSGLRYAELDELLLVKMVYRSSTTWVCMTPCAGRTLQQTTANGTK